MLSRASALPQPSGRKQPFATQKLQDLIPPSVRYVMLVGCVHFHLVPWET